MQVSEEMEMDQTQSLLSGKPQCGETADSHEKFCYHSLRCTWEVQTKWCIYSNHDLRVLRQTRPERARNVRKTGKTIEHGRLGERIQGTGEAVSKDAELGVFMQR